MKTILVPVDFSAASLNAANYALEFAQAVNANLTLLHVFQFPIAYSEIQIPAESLTGMIEEAEKNINEWRNEILHKAAGKIKVYSEVKQGSVIGEIEKYCQLVNPYTVVMGAQGTGKMERVLFGSNSLKALKILSWPLLLVPKGVQYHSISKVGLACDLQNVSKSVHAEQIRSLTTDLHAQLHVLHINTDKNKMISESEIRGSGLLREMFSGLKPEFHFRNHENTEEAVRSFSEENNIDLLIVIPKNHGLLGDLFHKSQAKQMTLHTHLPLLSIHE
jgi:nucleotide-binding universal stress UspA family protein